MCRKVAVFILLASSTAVQAETLIECAKIEDPGERVACYDKLAGRVEKKLNEPQIGTTEQRIEARNQSVAEEIVGEGAASPEIMTVEIERILRDRNRRVSYLTTDGRVFKRSSSATRNFNVGDVLTIQHGMMGSIFLVREDGFKIKVTEVSR